VVREASGEPLAGVQITLQHEEPAHRISVLSHADGRFSAEVASGERYIVTARRIGWRDGWWPDRDPREGPLELQLLRHTNPAAVAEQLPANHWYARVFAQIDDPALAHRLKRECTYCHQQGSLFTRRERSADEWRKIIGLMGRRGAMLPQEIRDPLPELFIRAYDREAAVPELTRGWEDAEAFAPVPAPEVLQARVDEWDLGGRASMQHDVVVHPGGTLYSVDASQDQLYRLTPRPGSGSLRESWPVPAPGLPTGGVFRGPTEPVSQTSNERVGPHSLQVAPDGSVWITLAAGNQLARFDPATERFEIHEVAEGIYPHTLRFDAEGILWYTMAASNHVGRFDPKTNEQQHIRLPARTFAQAAVLRILPFTMWLDRQFDLRGAASEGGGGFTMPVPYGIDIAPDGGVWFSQLNEDRIGRIDPKTFEITLIETPFPAPRRLRFDSKGTLWVPSFSAGLLAAFDPATGVFRSWPLPIDPLEGEAPYALHVDRRTDHVWVCGTNSDTLIRFAPETEHFAVYPMPTRVTYTRELDFDAQGRVWTSNSNSPAWQIEGGQPRVLRLDPTGGSQIRQEIACQGSACP
jgi:streptogramin lyase